MGKRIWITGGSSGLGAKLAQSMAEAEHDVAISARREDALERTVRGSAAPDRIYPFPVDTTDRVAVNKVVARIEEKLGPIDQAVLNAGTHRPVDARELNTDDFRALVEVNLMGTVHCLEALLPGMLARGRGRIAIVASLAGYRGLPTAAAYGMTKAGLINLAETLRAELWNHGIVVQVVNPGFVKTPLTDKNPFPMPFLMELDPAARALQRGLRSDRFEITFPWRFAVLMKLLRLLPAPVAFAVTRRLVPDQAASGGS